ncbi:MAG TPA: orotidine-5'-phosphate decarboxylase [Thermomicrobiaceae bacterium]|nr:orotidine-5'-phosphate decarboxylase [Thermomicrobiaceae bacterium]
MRFTDRLDAVVDAHQSLLCVGLDPDPRYIPRHLGDGAAAVIAFNRAIVEATADLACAFKPNLGFYLAYGPAGVEALAETRRLIPPQVPVILDAKVGDIATTAEAYARGYFDELNFDAVTAHPYLGADSLKPFLRYADRAVFVLAKTSNPGSGDLQDLNVSDSGADEPLYLRVADRVAAWQERFGTCGLVVGATYPRQLAEIRARCPDLPILVPGVGAQQGNLEATVRAGLDARDAGLLISASRAITYAGSDRKFAAAARDAAQVLRDQINRARGPA